MRKKTPLLPLLLLIAIVLPAAAQKTKPENLGPKYREWLTLVTYIILPQEKDVFLMLTSDIDRDIFIDAFWKQRDPTPGTPENEYRDEIKQRFQFVQKEFHKDTPREGWMTDRGRIYMLLGKPQSRESFYIKEIQPCELWFYNGDEGKDMPAGFGFIFYRHSGMGEYKLYSPTTDGPKKLLIYTNDIDTENAYDVFGAVKTSAPGLAPFLFSIIPNEIGMGYTPSVRTEIELARVLDSPKKSINPSYATHFLNYKGMVSTEYLTNFVECDSAVAVIRDPVAGIPFLHFDVAPKSISMDYYSAKDQYYCTFSADISLRKGKDVIYQYNKEFSYYFPPQDSAMVTANGVAVQDTFPIIAGSYHLTVLLRNPIGKEFSLLERDIVVDAGEAPRVSEPIIGYKMETLGADSFSAFKIEGRRLLVDAKNTFTPADTIAVLCNIENLTEELSRTGTVLMSVRGIKPSGASEKTFTFSIKTQDFRKPVSLSCEFPASDLIPDYYDVTVSLLAGGKTVAQGKSNLIVGLAKALPRPVILAKPFPRSDLHLQYLALAGQSEKAGAASAAETYYSLAMDIAPGDMEAAAYYCGFLMRSKNFAKALEWIEKIKDETRLRFDYYIIKGKALKELGRCEEAIPLLLEGNKIYNSDTRLLTALGACFYKTGQKDRALEALKASLRLDPDQDEAKRLVAEIEKK
jgi:GWxTD domain-containing protein